MIKIIEKTKIYQITLGFLIGLILSLYSIPGLLLSFFIIIAFIYFTNIKFIFMILFIILGFIYSLYWDTNIDRDIHNLSKENIAILTKVIEEPILKQYNQEVILKPENSNIFILGIFNKYENLNKGDELIIKGRMNTPAQSEFFDRIFYLKTKKIFLEVKNPTILALNSDKPSFDSILGDLKIKLGNILNQNLAEPQTTLAKGLIIGDDSNFSQELKDNLRNSGLSHITSVSGYNVGIIFAGILLLYRFVGRKKALLGGIIITLLFWQLVGSLNLPTQRATLMLSFVAMGIIAGRKVDLFYATLISTLIILLEYPYYFFNISFQLSLAALLGILILAPRLIKSLERLKMKNLFTEIIIVTLAVLIFTIPISFLTFKETSTLGLLSNILVLPLIPMITLLIIAALGLSILNLNILAEIIFLITNYFLKLIILIVNTIGSLSFSHISNTKLIVIFFILMTLPALYLVFKYKNDQ